jgi:hypothetical protein
MKRFLIPLLLVATSAGAYETNDGRYPIDMSKNFTNTTSVTFRIANDVTKECNAERTRRGFQKTDYKVDACSSWQEKSCVIIISKITNLETIGHEVAHCIQGSWHNE